MTSNGDTRHAGRNPHGRESSKDENQETRERPSGPPRQDDPWLRLENQLCFPFYAVSRLITRRYQPILEELNLTYPQYLVLLVLWEKDGVPVQALSDVLLLNTNTLSPLLKRLEGQGLISRSRDAADDRIVTIRLTPAGARLRHQAGDVPRALAADLDYPEPELMALRESVWKFLGALRNAN